MGSLIHTTHPHPLRYVDSENEFLCNGCGTFGSGKRYRCRNCNFNLHDDCATCPTNLSTFIHRKHPLKLTVNRRSEQDYYDRPCVVCEEQVQGLYYRCLTCHDFFLHPVCSTIPFKVHHVLDQDHPLKFKVASPRVCEICDDICTSGRYRCAPCGIDIHVDCITEPCFVVRINSSPSPVRSGGGGGSRGTVRRQQQPINFSSPSPSRSGGGTRGPVRPQQQQQQQQQLPNYAGFASGMLPFAPNYSSMPYFQGNGGFNTAAPSGSRRRRMCRVVGNIAATLALSAVLGAPVPITPF